MSQIEFRELDDLIWCLVALKTDEKLILGQFSKYCDEYYKKNNCLQKPLIAIQSDEQQKIHKIDVYAAKQSDYFNELAQSNTETVIIKLKIDVNEKHYAAHLSISPATKKQSANEVMSDYLGQLFSNLLITGRPLRYYNCTFFLPLDLVLDHQLGMQLNEIKFDFKDNDKIERYKLKPPSSLLDTKENRGNHTDDDIAHAQAYEYFHPLIQDQLFETIDSNQVKLDRFLQPIVHHRFKHSELKDYTLKLIDEKIETTAKIEDVSLYEYYNGMLLLGIRVGLPKNDLYQNLNAHCWVNEEDDKEKKQVQKKLKEEAPEIFELVCDENNWWKSLVFGNDAAWEEIKSLQVENWLRYTKLVRILYANFFEQYEEEKIAPVGLCNGSDVLAKSQVKDAFSPVVLYFLNAFLNIDKTELSRTKRLRQLTDERMFTHCSYVLVGKNPSPDSFEEKEIERLFSYALYVDQHTDGYDKAQGWAYDKKYLQQHMNQLTNKRWKSISSLSGFTNYSTVFMGFGGWFQNPTATVHVPYIYAKMQIQILFYKLTLQYLDRCISEATRKLKKSNGKENDFKNLQLSIIEFTNEYWFRDLTPQIQGKEIADQMIKQQALDEKYELIKDELDRASDYTTIVKDFKLQEKSVLVGWIAVIFGVMTLLPAIIESFLDNEKSAAGSIITVALMVFGALIYKVWKRKK